VLPTHREKGEIMRYTKTFSIHKRTLKSGKKVYYYRTRDEKGKRTVSKSTGQTTKAAAETYCLKLLKENSLIPPKEELFKDFARNWWIYDKCTYIKGRLVRGFSFSRMHADIKRMQLEKHIIPVFGDKKLNEISENLVENWLFDLKDKGLVNSTANHCLAILRIMLNEARRKKLINENPVAFIKPLKKTNKEKGILSLYEVQKLFYPIDINKTWINPVYYTINLLAASTGMRLGEVQALQGENVFPDHVRVCYSYERKYGLKDTKTHDTKEIDINPTLYKLLADLKIKNPTGYLFSVNGGEKPLYFKSITDALYIALNNIGITEQERKARNITFHSWRHFMNTSMRGKLEDYKLRYLTGHKTQEMTEHYTHIEKEDLKALVSFQESLFAVSPETAAPQGVN